MVYPKHVKTIYGIFLKKPQNTEKIGIAFLFRNYYNKSCTSIFEVFLYDKNLIFCNTLVMI